LTSRYVSFPFISTIWGGFFKRKSHLERVALPLGVFFLAKWEALWRKVLLGRVLECI
jgi:hypothetical protein